ncbi:MAG: 30S ribosomal protein S20 [Oscillospiraceae bacterium]|nr:30S ribosomal protein S20 [Oscillospiraceae bacterium]
MANIKSAKKRVLVTAAKSARNRSEKSSLKTSIKKASAAAAEGDKALAAAAYKSAQSSIDKAVTHGILHKNTAARRKSKLARQLASAE